MGIDLECPDHVTRVCYLILLLLAKDKQLVLFSFMPSNSYPTLYLLSKHIQFVSSTLAIESLPLPFVFISSSSQAPTSL